MYLYYQSLVRVLTNSEFDQINCKNSLSFIFLMKLQWILYSNLHSKLPMVSNKDFFSRLILERSGSAKSAVQIVTSLIDQHGQGGRFGVDTPRPYCGVFLIADKGEAWLVECAGKSWVAKQITGECRCNRRGSKGA